MVQERGYGESALEQRAETLRREAAEDQAGNIHFEFIEALQLSGVAPEQLEEYFLEVDPRAMSYKHVIVRLGDFARFSRFFQKKLEAGIAPETLEKLRLESLAEEDDPESAMLREIFDLKEKSEAGIEGETIALSDEAEFAADALDTIREAQASSLFARLGPHDSLAGYELGHIRALAVAHYYVTGENPFPDALRELTRSLAELYRQTGVHIPDWLPPGESEPVALTTDNFYYVATRLLDSPRASLEPDVSPADLRSVIASFDASLREELVRLSQEVRSPNELLAIILGDDAAFPFLRKEDRLQ